ncbi:TonB-dependent hemoglobin/transferrin/lactoferrin family receptor [Achromobacter xylosoxidans]|uniref:TonB-dependent hemoglobin/transferrin/lactoferrin family receptor n=1 Tax=Alcaligenes xylosoxydans xylosoxydans TaxID=85698 RepID=UPI0022B8F3B2|nr:TonB-dependent hemoglobin/transferrin/lactoferrin family receptor [Achromobacter xylosoxidans]MCZ8384325.1 TonB-dependent hemoglobin/transferrin/lactoferrin family receptor [Achromobacter xylosoxidans]
MKFRVAGRMLAAGALALPCVSVAQTQERASGISAPADRKDDERQRTFVFDIPAQAMAQAVLAFARQAGVDLYMNDVDLSAYTSVALKGSFNVETGLARLLGNSPIGYRYRRTAGAVRPNVQLVDNGPGARARVYSMAPVVVRGNDVNERVYQAPRAVSIVTREEMDRVPVRHAAELIQDTPGVASAVNRQNPGLSINIRGMQDFGRVNMMIDGMRQDFVQNGHMQRNGEMYVDSELLSEVEVERGVVRGVHGTGAMAGSVDFRTLDFGDVLREGRDIGLKLRGTSGMGYQGNGTNFIGSAAGAARAGENLEVLAAVSRRSIGDYRFGLRGGQSEWNQSVVRDSVGRRSKVEFNDVKFAAQEQDSSLFKARWKLNDASSLQLSYVGTQVNYSYTLESVMASPDNSGSPWRKLGASKAQSDSYALDYKLKPADKPWLDLNVKLYAVDTRVRNYTEPNYPRIVLDGLITDPAQIRESIHFEYWRPDGTGKCEVDGQKSDYAVDVCSHYGIGKETRLRTKTHGVQVDNTSRFMLGRDTLLSAHYGIEYFSDRATSRRRWNNQGRQVSPVDMDGKDSLNPRARRSMGSLFAELKLEDDLYTVSAGLRYERYQVKGKTQMPGTAPYHRTSLMLAEQTLCNSASVIDNPGNVTNRNEIYGEGCRIARTGNLAALKEWWDSDPVFEYHEPLRDRVLVPLKNRPGKFGVKFVDRRDPQTGEILYSPKVSKTSLNRFHRPLEINYPDTWWNNQPTMYEYDVRRSGGKLLPSLSAAIRPTRWLELYGSWGKSWRPPAINELMMAGAHPTDGFETIVPNPFLAPETAKTWEVGVNTIFKDVVAQGDNLSFKAGYFDTRTENYLFSSMMSLLPGREQSPWPNYFPLSPAIVFTNNLASTRFRGLELEGRYDAGFVYGGVSYTHYLGGPNQFCKKMYPLGSGPNRFDERRADGSYPAEHDEALAAGYDSWRAWADAWTSCGNFVFNSAIAKPVDKGMVLVGARLLERKVDTGVRFNYSGEGWYNRDTGGAQVWFKYTTWDWYASYQANDNVKLMAAVENITNRMYVEGYSDALARTFAPGRTVTVGMEVRF